MAGVNFSGKKIFFLIIAAALAIISYLLYHYGFFGPGKSEPGELKIFGNVEFRQVFLGFRIPGRLDALNFEEGEIVAQGDLIAELNPAPYETDRLQAQAMLDKTARNVALQDGSWPEDVEVAKARLAGAEIALSDTKLYAPADGILLTRVMEPGTVAAAGQTVAAVMLRKPVQVRAYVTEAQLGLVRMGMNGKIFTDSHPDPLDGTINYISSDAEFTPKQIQTEDQRTGLVYRIRLIIENDDGRLKNGMPVTVILERQP